MKAAKFDARFDAGEDMGDHVDWSSVRRPNLEARRVNFDLPTWVVEGLERRARSLGVSPDSLVESWISDRLA